MTALLSDYREILGTAWMLGVLLLLTWRAWRDREREHWRHIAQQFEAATLRAASGCGCDVCSVQVPSMHVRRLSDDAAVLCDGCDATMYGAEVNV